MQHDVVIAGAGLAGLCLARQLRLRFPELGVALIDRAKRPLPEGAHKVGESTVAVGGYYLEETLGLREYLAREHILKLGLRYFFPGAANDFASRPELGPARYRTFLGSQHAVPEWQLDRGKLENDLRGMAAESGVALTEGAKVVDVDLGDDVHRVCVERDGHREWLTCRWFIDATGRRQFLARKLDIPRQQDQLHSAVWFRVRGRIDVSTFVPKANSSWHDRVPGDHPSDPSFGRYNSTNHLLGRGYWVWLIPLSSGHTSVGIVGREDLTGIGQLKDYDDAAAWLERYEPILAGRLRGAAVADFHRLRKYSHSCDEVLSARRWAITGEAGCFIDPFYSPGTDAIAYMNCIICESIALDQARRFSPAVANAFGADYLGWSRLATEGIQAGYPMFGNPVVGCSKIMWDFALSNAITLSTFLDVRLIPGGLLQRVTWPEERSMDLRAKVGRLNARVAKLFAQWLDKSQGNLSFEFVEMLDDHPVTCGAVGNPVRKGEHPLDRWFHGYELLRRFAAALFECAVADTMPEQLGKLREVGCIVPEKISLDPTDWESSGLFGDGGIPRHEYAEYTARLFDVFRPRIPGQRTERLS